MKTKTTSRKIEWKGDPGAVKGKRRNQVLQMWEGGTFQEGGLCPQSREKEKVIPLMTFDEDWGWSGALLH